MELMRAECAMKCFGKAALDSGTPRLPLHISTCELSQADLHEVPRLSHGVAGCATLCMLEEADIPFSVGA